MQAHASVVPEINEDKFKLVKELNVLNPLRRVIRLTSGRIDGRLGISLVLDKVAVLSACLLLVGLAG